MLNALKDTGAFKSQKGLTDGDFLALGDLNHDGRVSNGDIQPLLDTLILSQITGPGNAPIANPEAASLAVWTGLGLLGLGFISVRARGWQPTSAG